MTTINQMRARRKLIRILPREALERMSNHERSHTLSITQLERLAVEHWDLQEVHDELIRILRRADPEGTSP